MTTFHEVMADGIGDVHFASLEWVEIARQQMTQLLTANPLTGQRFTMCEVGHNAPAYLDAGASLAWHAKISDGRIEIGSGELATTECDLKIECDHSIISNIARIKYAGNDPAAVSIAIDSLSAQTRWKIHGNMPEDPALLSLLRTFHDKMAPRTMPRFVWMSPDWVEIVRRFLTTRATSEKYREDLKGTNYLFAEEFHEPPRYVSPNSEPAGFWVNCQDGLLDVGHGAFADAATAADGFTKGLYNIVLPVGRTVEASMSDADIAEKEQYMAAAFRFDKARNQRPIEQSSPSGRGAMPRPLARVFAPLHDEISKRTSGELPADFHESKTSSALRFDRQADYDPSWLRYDKVDVSGNDIQA